MLPDKRTPQFFFVCFDFPRPFLVLVARLPVASARRGRVDGAVAERGDGLTCMIGPPSHCGIDPSGAKQGTRGPGQNECGHHQRVHGEPTKQASKPRKSKAEYDRTKWHAKHAADVGSF